MPTPKQVVVRGLGSKKNRGCNGCTGRFSIFVGKNLHHPATDAHSEWAADTLMTRTCIPGVMSIEVPKSRYSIYQSHQAGTKEKGRGREILNVIRSADMVLYIVDPSKMPTSMKTLRGTA